MEAVTLFLTEMHYITIVLYLNNSIFENIFGEKYFEGPRITDFITVVTKTFCIVFIMSMNTCKYTEM